MATQPIPDVLTLDAPEQPATMAGVMFRIAAALEILPEPLAVHIDGYGLDSHSYVQVNSPADWESWRQWLGAPAADPSEWKSYQTSADTPMLRQREWKTSAVWRGHTITLVRVEMVPAEQVST